MLFVVLKITFIFNCSTLGANLYRVNKLNTGNFDYKTVPLPDILSLIKSFNSAGKTSVISFISPSEIK